MQPHPSIFTISPGRPFLRTLAEAILAGAIPVRSDAPPTPVSLSKYTLLLPTRRAAQALREAFLAATDGRAMLLPKLLPIAEGQEDLSLLAGVADPSALGPDHADIAPAMSELERRLTLTELVLAWSRAMRAAAATGGDLAVAAHAGVRTPAQALALAGELTRLMDLVETEEVALDKLATLVPDEYAAHWAKTLDFLKIIVDVWPALLAEQGKLSRLGRRNQVLRAEARRLATLPPGHPVIVAGVTGSIPATAALMKVVASLPNGAIVLPGLDTDLTDDDARLIAAEHPEHAQHGLLRLLDALGIARTSVRELPGAETTGAAGRQRRRLIGEAMRPAASTDRWHHFVSDADRTHLAGALDGLNRIEAPTAQDEAEVVALILREALETPGRTAALVSPDRMLARRVGVRLAAFGIKVDDSAGRPFGKTVSGAFLDLVVEAAAKQFAPAPLMALLKHPLTRLGLPVAAVRRAARHLELTAFRTVYLGNGFDGIDEAVERAARETAGDTDIATRRPRAVRRLWEADWTAARDLVQRLRAAYRPWLDLGPDHSHRLQDLAAAHIAVAEAISTPPFELSPTDSPASERKPLYEGEAGEAAQGIFAGLLDPHLRAPNLAPLDYPDFYRGLVAAEAVRPRTAVNPRVSIWGPFEARLQQPDVVVLGSLNEGTWPEAADPGPWLNRPMRRTLGLPSPDERIGHAAHDVAMLLGAAEVYLTRALKVDGNPTVPSRWLMRIEALLGGLGLTAGLEPDRPWLAWARARDLTGPVRPVSPPAPCPPLDARPRQLSVTAVERWLSNPYAVYAAQILKLEALPALGKAPDHALKGSVVHAALGRFTARYPQSLPTDVKAALMEDLGAVIGDFTGSTRIAAFWLPRFERFATWFADYEPERRKAISRVHAEVTGRLVLDAPAGPFTLTARADRIEVGPDGLGIVDFKTGAAPDAGRVASGAAPQLPLEAAIARAGGFAGIDPAPIARLTYIRASGSTPPGKASQIIKDIEAITDRSLAGLEALVARYDDPTTPYRALRRSTFKYEYDDFAHLARVSEWGIGGADDPETEDAAR